MTLNEKRDYKICVYKDCIREMEDTWLGYCAKHEKLYHNALDDMIHEADEMEGEW